MNSILSSLAAVVLGLMMSLNIVSAPTQKVGSLVPSTPALVDTFLAVPMGTGDTSMTLATGTTNDGTALSGFMCFTIDVNTPQVEYVCGTASSTSITSLTRGIDLTNPNATTTRVYSHRRFASVQATDYPTIQFMSRKLNGVDTFDNVLSYTVPKTFTNNSQIIDKGYADGLTFAGAPNASPTQKGIIQEATAAQCAIGSTTGSTGADLFCPNSLFNITPTATTLVPVTNTNGKLAQGFLDLTQAFTFSGGLTSTATTTLGTTTVNGVDVGTYLTAPTWTKLGETTLATSSRSITVGGLPARKNLKVILHATGFTSSAPAGYLTFNADTGANYGYRLSTNGGADATATGTTEIRLGSISSSTEDILLDIENYATNYKLINVEQTIDNGTSSAPMRIDGVGEWYNNTNAISSIKIDSGGSSPLFATSTWMTVYGSND